MFHYVVESIYIDYFIWSAGFFVSFHFAIYDFLLDSILMHALIFRADNIMNITYEILELL
jgi:hypothetical protein